MVQNQIIKAAITFLTDITKKGFNISFNYRLLVESSTEFLIYRLMIEFK